MLCILKLSLISGAEFPGNETELTPAAQALLDDVVNLLTH